MNELEAAFAKRETRKLPALVPKTHEVLKKEHDLLQIPVLPFINVGPEFVGKVSVKYNVGGDFRNVPEGVKEKKQTMNSVARMAANLKLAVEVGGEGLDNKERLPGRVHDTALGILGGKNVKLLRVSGMTDFGKFGLNLVDVNCQRSGGGNYVVVFEYIRTTPEQTFTHCEEKLAKELELGFSRATSMMTTVFWNPNRTVTVNVGPYVSALAKKSLVIGQQDGFPVLKLEDVTKK